MAGRKKQTATAEDGLNFEKIKDQVLSIITGQETGSNEKLDYVKILTRATLLLVTIYGVGRVRLIRQLAISIASSYATKWLAEKAADKIAEGEPVLQRK